MTLTDWIALVSAIFTAVAALAAAGALIYAGVERRMDMKEDFVLWSIERLRQKDLREYRAMIFGLSDKEVQDLAQVARTHKVDPRLDQVRKVCLSFDEIGYFVYKVGIVSFRDILDMYSQTVKIRNKVSPIILAWREIEGPTSFMYFEMLARQKKFEVSPEFADPIALYDITA